VRQAQGVQHQSRSLISCIVGSVAEAEAGARETRGAARDQRANGEQLVAASTPRDVPPWSPPGRRTCVK